MKKKVFIDDIYDVQVIAIYGDFEEAKKFLKEKVCEWEPTDIFTQGFCTSNPKGGFILWLNNNKDFYMLMHEVVHLVRMVFTPSGVITDLSIGDEHIAYYQVYWFRRLWRWFSRVKKGGGKNV